MKKTTAAIAIFLVFISIFAGCSKQSDPDNITFTGEILEVHDQSLLISPEEGFGYDKVSVNVSDVQASFNYIVGQTVKVTILPQIAESYPPQARAVDIQLVSGP